MHACMCQALFRVRGAASQTTCTRLPLLPLLLSCCAVQVSRGAEDAKDAVSDTGDRIKNAASGAADDSEGALKKAQKNVNRAAEDAKENVQARARVPRGLLAAAPAHACAPAPRCTACIDAPAAAVAACRRRMTPPRRRPGEMRSMLLPHSARTWCCTWARPSFVHAVCMRLSAHAQHRSQHPAAACHLFVCASQRRRRVSQGGRRGPGRPPAGQEVRRPCNPGPVLLHAACMRVADERRG